MHGSASLRASIQHGSAKEAAPKILFTNQLICKYEFLHYGIIRTRETYFKRLNQYFNGEITEECFSRCIASSDGRIRWFGFKNILKDLASEDVCSSGLNRVKRGGSYNNNASNSTASNRNNNGLRLASTMSEQTGFHSEMPVSQQYGNKYAIVQLASSF